MIGHNRLVETEGARLSTERFEERRRVLEEEVANGERTIPVGGLRVPDGLSIAQSLSDITDEWLRALWNEASGDAIGGRLVALGGYGRQELSWSSDVDLVIEVDEAEWESPELVESVERFMAWCREPRVKVAHAVRVSSHLIPEFRNDFRTAVAYLDARPLGADDALRRKEIAAEFLRDVDEGIGFVDDLMVGYRARLQRFGQTIYRLEPELKNGPGGLRDLHSILWGAEARFNSLSGAPGVDSSTLQDLRAARAWILGLRLLIHLRHGRKQDRLNFPDQEWLAEKLLDHGEMRERAEALMRSHYETTKSVSRHAERLLRLWGTQDQKERNLAAGFIAGETTLSWEGASFVADNVIDGLELASREDLFVNAELETHMLNSLRDWTPNQRQIERVSKLLFDHETSRLTSTRILDLGVLTEIVPEFAPLVCHVQHDVYHVYTTDVHSVRCLEAGRDLLNNQGEIVEKWPSVFELVDGVEKDVFLAACLFHDIGKNRGGGHSEKGARLMVDVAPRLGFGPDAAQTLVFLVREHLTLAHAARRRDTQDPKLIRELANLVRTTRTLRTLTLLTFCDMATVGDNVLTDWNASLLLGLHHRIEQMLVHGAEDTWQRNESRIREIEEWLLEEGHDSGHVERFLRDVPSGHLVETPAQALGRQFLAYEASMATTPIVVTSNLEDEGVTEVIVATIDRPGTLARITGTISANGLTILGARIVSTHNGKTLDIFQVEKSGGHGAWSGGSEPLGARRAAKLEEQLKGVLSGELDVRELLDKRLSEGKLGRKPTPAVDQKVEILEISEEFTVFEISAEDRIGLLYEIASALENSGVDIQLSKIDSVGTQVVDTFYVEELSGGALSPQRAQEVKTSLERVIGKRSE